MSQEKVIVGKNAKSNFGRKGWYLIIILGLSMYMQVGIISEGMNIVIPAFSEIYGWETSTLFGYNAIAGWIGVIGAILWAIAVSRIKNGAKTIFSVGLVCCAVCVILWGRISAPWQYLLMMCLVQFFLQAFGGSALASLLANWFPTKKGLVMGWATIGISMASIAYMPMMNGFVVNFGLPNAFICMAAIMILNFLLSIPIKNTPEQAGTYPDNDPNMTPAERDKMAQVVDTFKRTSSWSVKKLFTTKEVWKLMLSQGILLLSALGLMSSILVRLTAMGGLDRNAAIGMISLGGVFSAAFSYLTGVVDTKVGTKKATMMVYILYIIAMGLSFIMVPQMQIFVVMMIVAVSGGANNLGLSAGVSVFGRFDYPRAVIVVTPMGSIIRSLGYMVVGALVVTNANGIPDYTNSNILLLAIMVVGLIITITMKFVLIGRSEEEAKEAVKKLVAEEAAGGNLSPEAAAQMDAEITEDEDALPKKPGV
ncbi:MFS transporter [Christensenellaceae bacterium OttesenSCG-928-K19]|nr:MFS transporter [Christensenellaceae bacterium OttesenSCG-928-K19]